jgi:SAM-dependent methyltransferase
MSTLSPTSPTSASQQPGSSPALADLKAKQHQIWSSGDYGRIAWVTVPLARVLTTAVAVRPGSRVLDVACGTGHVALEAARSFCEVTGVDYVPALVETARRRAQAEGLAVDFREADAESLPFGDDSFDFVLSAIGVMFTADHERAAAELVRVARPGGRIGLASWTPTGFVGGLLATVGRHVPPPAAAKPATRWGTEEVVTALLGDGVRDVTTRQESVTQLFCSSEHFADFFLTYYGPTRAAAARLDEEGRAALRADLVTLAEDHNRAEDGTFRGDWDYLVVTATKQ